MIISGHKGNGNNHHTTIPPHAGKDVGEKEPSYTAGGNVN
jgi:hypothetical protein